VNLVAVVLNWNGGDDTLDALASLEGVATICVDNGSTDGSDLRVAQRFPEVELVRTGANLGFAGGNNAGIRRALERGADWMLLLNNDGVAEPGLAAALERAAGERPDAGLLACDPRRRRETVSIRAHDLTRASAIRARRTTRSSATSRARRAALAVRGRSDSGLLDESLFRTSRTSSGRCACGGRAAVVLVPTRASGTRALPRRAGHLDGTFHARNTIVVSERCARCRAA
jgi:glycosyltransferase involved in cell wall biosynthesis